MDVDMLNVMKPDRADIEALGRLLGEPEEHLTAADRDRRRKPPKYDESNCCPAARGKRPKRNHEVYEQSFGYTEEQTELLKHFGEWKRSQDIKFPTITQMVDFLLTQGYEKVNAPSGITVRKPSFSKLQRWILATLYADHERIYRRNGGSVRVYALSRDDIIRGYYGKKTNGGRAVAAASIRRLSETGYVVIYCSTPGKVPGTHASKDRIKTLDFRYFTPEIYRKKKYVILTEKGIGKAKELLQFK